MVDTKKGVQDQVHVPTGTPTPGSRICELVVHIGLERLVEFKHKTTGDSVVVISTSWPYKWQSGGKDPYSPTNLGSGM